MVFRWLSCQWYVCVGGWFICGLFSIQVWFKVRGMIVDGSVVVHFVETGVDLVQHWFDIGSYF